MNTAEKYEVLLSTISHEIRNPVTLINSYLQLIADAHPEVGSYEYWDTVGEEMQHLKILLTDLSRFNNSIRIHSVSLNMNTWLHAYTLHANAFLRSLFPAGNAMIPFTTEISDNLPVIFADPDKLQQVLDNLIRNAAEAIFDGSITAFAPSLSGQITLSAHSDKSMLFLTVTDNGCGISPEQLEHIFEPFVSYKTNGSGLGLAIVQRIIKAHHGTISVHSEPSSGTRFLICLPVISDTK